FFQAEDGIRDLTVTGVQTCALPICGLRGLGVQRGDRVAIRLGNGVDWVLAFLGAVLADAIVVPVNTRFTKEEANYVVTDSGATRSEERRVGKECRSRWSADS